MNCPGTRFYVGSSESLNDHDEDLDAMQSHIDFPERQERDTNLWTLTENREDSKTIPNASTSNQQRGSINLSTTEDSSPLFIELIELEEYGPDEYEWTERARWIRYEEDCDNKFNSWDSPHISVDSHENMMMLKHRLISGVIILDMHADNMRDVFNQLATSFIEIGLLAKENKQNFVDCLLLPHRHQRPLIQPRKSVVNMPGFKNLLKRSSNVMPDVKQVAAPSTPSSLACVRNANSFLTVPKLRQMTGTPSAAELSIGNQIPMERIPYRSSSIFTDMQLRASIVGNFDRKGEEEMVKRLSSSTEALIVLTGRPSFVARPLTAFIRLQSVKVQEQVIELPIPLRFMFIHFDSNEEKFRYHTIGRSMCVLMNNQEYKTMATKTRLRSAIIDGIQKFISSCILVPSNIKLDVKDENKVHRLADDLIQYMNVIKNRQTIRPVLYNEDEYVLPDDLKVDKPFRPFERRKSLFYGVSMEVQLLGKYYWKSINSAFNWTCLLCVFTMFITCLVPTITFGAILAEATDQMLDVKKMLLATSMNGMLFSALSGQPLLILGPTGPMLIIEEFILEMSNHFKVNFIAARLWVSVWVEVFTIIVVAFEGPFMIRYFSRFSEEIFAVVIALTYFYEPIKWLVKTYKANPILLNYTNVNKSALCELEMNSSCNNVTKKPLPNIALLSTLLMLGTAIVAIKMSNIRFSKLFNKTTRKLIGMSSLFISITVMVSLDHLLTPGIVVTKRVYVPNASLNHSMPWNVDWWLVTSDGVNRSWLYFGTMLPAILTLIVIFIETELVGLVLKRKPIKIYYLANKGYLYDNIQNA
ncbi:hypothetical protein ACOME3_007229 [Neoechinorhynchus agilis]